MEKISLEEVQRLLQEKLNSYIEMTGLTNLGYAERLPFTPHNVKYWRVRHLGRIDSLKTAISLIERHRNFEVYEVKLQVIAQKAEEEVDKKYGHKCTMWLYCEDCEVVESYLFIPGKKGCYGKHKEHVKTIGFISQEKAEKYLDEVLQQKAFNVDGWANY